MTEMPEFFADVFRCSITPEQARCSHFLARIMADGVWFCPSCNLRRPPEAKS